MKKAIYTGSFDPFTIGHLEIVLRTVHDYDMLIINVEHNSEKNPLFSVETRLKMIKNTLVKYDWFLSKVKLIADDGLIADIALREQAYTLIRGVRANSNDLPIEKSLATINEQFGKIRGIDLKTRLVLINDNRISLISSTNIKILCDLKEFIIAQSMVPCFVYQMLLETYLKKYLTFFPNFKNEDSKSAFYADIFSEKTWQYYNYNTSLEYLELKGIPEDVYLYARTIFLDKFLQRNRIFQTKFFFDKFEQQARKNISNEIERLNRCLK